VSAFEVVTGVCELVAECCRCRSFTTKQVGESRLGKWRASRKEEAILWYPVWHALAFSSFYFRFLLVLHVAAVISSWSQLTDKVHCHIIAESACDFISHYMTDYRFISLAPRSSGNVVGQLASVTSLYAKPG